MERVYTKGMKNINNQGYEIEIIEEIKANCIKIKFLDCHGSEIIINNNSFIKGTVRNPYHPSVFNMGYLGQGKYTVTDDFDKLTPQYISWSSMIRRCYSEYTHKLQPTYNNISTCDEWLNFQAFGEWYDNNFPKHLKGIEFQLDKDLLQLNKEIKTYSPETCLFIPKKVNTFLTNIKQTNSTGFVGISYDSKRHKWACRISDFNTNKRIALGATIHEDKLEYLSDLYIKYRIKNIEDVLKYLVELDYLNISTINKIKKELMSNV